MKMPCGSSLTGCQRTHCWWRHAACTLRRWAATAGSQLLERTWPDLEDFRPAMDALWNFLTPQNFPSADLAQIRLVGFSQGAALGYGLALAYPQRVQAFAGLSGFAPGGVEPLVKAQPLAGKALFHGTRHAGCSSCQWHALARHGKHSWKRAPR